MDIDSEDKKYEHAKKKYDKQTEGNYSFEIYDETEKTKSNEEELEKRVAETITLTR